MMIQIKSKKSKSLNLVTFDVPHRKHFILLTTCKVFVVSSKPRQEQQKQFEWEIFLVFPPLKKTSEINELTIVSFHRSWSDGCVVRGEGWVILCDGVDNIVYHTPLAMCFVSTITLISLGAPQKIKMSFLVTLNFRWEGVRIKSWQPKWHWIWILEEKISLCFVLWNTSLCTLWNIS